MAPSTENQEERSKEVGAAFDAVVVGAGFAGLYMLHRLRGLGFTARVYEAGGGVGGTWYWNRYPGARCDVESMQYSFSFSEELDQQWDWSEKYAPQPEILSLRQPRRRPVRSPRRTFVFDTRVTAASFDETAKCWRIETDRGDKVSAKFCIMAVGCLSAAKPSAISGAWRISAARSITPANGRMKGSTLPGFASASSAPVPRRSSRSRSSRSRPSALTVFQRTATYSVPAWNEKLTPEYRKTIKADYPALRAKARARPTGFYFPFNMKPALEATRRGARPTIRGGLGTRRTALPRRLWRLLFEKAANDTIAEFARRKIRGIVKDPATAELLCPDNVFGCKRLCVDTGYFETYNLPHVKLVDVSKTPIERFTARRHRGRRRRISARRHGLRHRFCGDDGLVRQDPDHRPQRPDPGREVARRPPRLSRRRVRGLSQSVHHHRARQPVGAGEHDPGDRAARRLDGGLHRRICATSARPPSSRSSATRTNGSSTSTRCQRSRCGRPAVPGMSAPTSPAGRACSCPISAAFRSMCKNATRS